MSTQQIIEAWENGLEPYTPVVFTACPDRECALDGGGSNWSTFCDACGKELFTPSEQQRKDTK